MTTIIITADTATITTDKETATQLLFKNPNCESEIIDDNVVLTYDITQLNTITALLNHRKK